MGADEGALLRIEQELEHSRESARRLLDSLAQKLRIKRVAYSAGTGVGHAANYVQSHSWKDVAAGIDRFVRERPVSSLLLAATAGFLVGRVLRPR